MKRIGQKTGAVRQGTGARDPRRVPLIVPHGGAESGRDFESAFDVLRRDERTRELWRGVPAKPRVARAS
ncbi:MAG TPA: hypothetical protein VFE34_18785 [Dongiaceae bacterium]|jgi:hypothetical protein|nr:hypothetical protein [Dongiaceae bacterium]